MGRGGGALVCAPRAPPAGEGRSMCRPRRGHRSRSDHASSIRHLTFHRAIWGGTSARHERMGCAARERFVSHVGEAVWNIGTDRAMEAGNDCGHRRPAVAPPSPDTHRRRSPERSLAQGVREACEQARRRAVTQPSAPAAREGPRCRVRRAARTFPPYTGYGTTSHACDRRRLVDIWCTIASTSTITPAATSFAMAVVVAL
jgi:hypothetical protein